MIGFHVQNSPSEWPRAVAKLPAPAPVKMVFGVERCRESKAANPGAKTWYRWVGDQPLPSSNYEEHARQWLNQFVDGTFRREAQFVDYVGEYNETLANSQGPEEKARWIALHTAMAKVWYEEYRQEAALSHIRMTLCAAAIGNDIPVEIAHAGVRYDAPLDYHTYIVCRVGNVSTSGFRSMLESAPVRHDAPRAGFRVAPGGELYADGKLYKMMRTMGPSAFRTVAESAATVINRPAYVSPHDWQWYSGRWAMMDAQYAAAGVRPDWIFGEGGPVLDASTDWSGWLDPMGGWKHKDCLGGDFNKYLAVMEYWLDNTMTTDAWREGRVHGMTVFTSGAPGSGPSWDHFDVIQPEMDRLADFAAAYNYTPTDPPEPPIEPPIEPPAGDNMLTNPSFENGWTDIAMTAQQPNGWTLERAANGVDVRGRPVTGQPECVHKSKLPPDEQLGGKNALILDGDYVYKIFESNATWKAWLTQSVVAEPGAELRLTVPVNIHFDGRPDEYDPLDTLVEIGVNEYSYQLFMDKEHDRQWQYLSLDVIVSDDGVLRVWLAISVKWEHPTSVFIDDLRLEYVDVPEPPEPPEPDCKGEPREQYARRVHVLPSGATKEQWLHVAGIAFDNERQTIGGSYDDAGIGALDSKTAILWGLAPEQHQTFITWYSEEYPGTIVQFKDFTPAEHEIVDIVDELPTHETKEYSTRALVDISDLIIHHTVSPDDRTAASIAAFHVNSRGWPGIGYHFLIGADGTIEQTNRLETVSYHASAANGYSVGIGLKGDFTNEVPSDAQLDAAAWLVGRLRSELDIDSVYGHKEADGAATQCPGDTWDEWQGRIV